MRDPLSQTAEKVRNVVHQRGSITLSELESEIDSSYNLIFLAIERMVAQSVIQIRRSGRDYILSKDVREDVSDHLLSGPYSSAVLPGHRIGSKLPGEVSLWTESQCLAQELE